MERGLRVFTFCSIAIAGGIPLSAVIARKEIMDGIPAGIIGGTYGGNALACAAGVKVLEVIENFVRAQPMAINPFVQLEIAAILYFASLMYYKRQHGG